MDYVTVMEVNIPIRGNHSCTACLPPITTKCCFLKLETENVLLLCQVCGLFKKNSNFCLYYGAKIKICVMPKKISAMSDEERNGYPVDKTLLYLTSLSS